MPGGIHEELAVVSSIDPDAYTAATYNGDEIDMSKFEEVLFIVQAGTLGASATIDYKVQSAATSGGSFSDISGKAITQLTQAGSDDDKQAEIRVRAKDLADGQRFIKDALTVGTATSDVSAIALARKPNHEPATDDDLASVDEIVA